ncbi:16S rRNA (cytidine(1402)-2'-O)-methyltransferase [Fulvivirga sp. 29W222]|uniref:Ribosomal RNA small subunit methyltransferase I n=1 Tax=Fulvivirga marina TaxID=2494733 RepID=A0A937FVB3_9BACT|nr:16S rRNA (cytidine(1402)-2'-O)-methyltransferase [Fulvivirga marina]MBL6445005.1 16S rRNA (cytidine(1402)-2'-O)-methyltransferase [Fulvivirga marina]
MEQETQLYLVPTPIGNLEDITIRAINVLKAADVILAEDTRTSSKLLKKYEISRPLQSYHIFNEHKTVSQLVDRLNKGERMALITDAGTPSISDPGFLLVRECLKAGIKLECLPGATAFVPALVKSGLPSDKFVFEGFLPHKKGRKTRLEILSTEERTIILYESPHRLVKALEQLAEHLGKDRQASVSRELTKLHEETVNGSLVELKEHFGKGTVKGEIVIVIDGKK